MRIISGKFGGRRFDPKADKWPTRPTTDIAKEALYNIMQNLSDFDSMKMLDLFGGTGNHCYECISRGCTHTDYVELYTPAIKFVKILSKKLEIEDYLNIYKMDVFKYVKICKHSYNYIFAGPPYGLKNISDIPNIIFEQNLLDKDGIFVLETDLHHDFSDDQRLFDRRNYGQTVFHFFSNS